MAFHISFDLFLVFDRTWQSWPKAHLEPMNLNWLQWTFPQAWPKQKASKSQEKKTKKKLMFVFENFDSGVERKVSYNVSVQKAQVLSLSLQLLYFLTDTLQHWILLLLF